jgi:rhamnosyltransferase
MIEISIIIPVKNGVYTLKACLEGIFAQTLIGAIEVIVIDSGSTDGSLEIVRSFPVKLYKILPEDFNHGTTRNYGVNLAKGEFVVMTVQDAVPANNKWLETMISHFKDHKVAGVCGQQIVPHDKDKNPAQWFRPYSKPQVIKYQFNNRNDFLSLTSEKQREICAWENITAAYRRETLLKHPFQKTITAEDLLWAKEVILQGHAILYDKNAKVYHYHHESFYGLFKRSIIDSYIDYFAFGIVKRNKCFLKKNLTAIYLVIISKLGPLSTLKWIAYNIKLITIRNLAVNIFLISTWIDKEKGKKWLFFKLNKNFPIGKIKNGKK